MAEIDNDVIDFDKHLFAESAHIVVNVLIFKFDILLSELIVDAQQLTQQ